MLNDIPQNTTQDLPKGGVPNKQAQVQRALAMSSEMLDILASIARNEKAQDSSRVSAAGKIIDKALPNMQATELTGKDGQQLIQFGFLKDFISAGGWNVPASNRSPQGSDEVQGADMAQKSPQNNDSSGEDKPRSP